MASGDTVSGAVNIQKVQDDVLKLWSVVKALPEISSDQKNRIKSLYEGVVRLNPHPTPRSRRSSSQFLQPQVTGVTAVTSLSSDKIPLLHLKRKVSSTWEYSSSLTGVYLDILHEIATSGTTFKDKNTLLTGVLLVSRSLKAFCLVVPTSLSRLRVTAVRLLNTTNQSSSLLAVAARLSLSFLSIRPRNRMLKLSWIISMPTSAWIWTTSYLSLVSPRTVEKLMGWTTNLN